MAIGNTIVDTILQYVIDDTKRPDMEEVILRRIQRAILKYHRQDFYKKDLIEQTYIFSSSGNIQILNTKFLTRFRSFQYVRKWRTQDAAGNTILDPQFGTKGTVTNGDITERSPDRMFDGYGGDLNDVMYRSGDNINIRVSENIDRVFIGYFSDPILDPIIAITSWIAKDYPNLIAAEVKWRIFADIGKDQEKQLAVGEMSSELLQLQTNNIRLAMA